MLVGNLPLKGEGGDASYFLVKQAKKKKKNIGSVAA